MGRRRPNWNRNKKREDGTTSKDNWRRQYDTAAAGSNNGNWFVNLQEFLNQHDGLLQCDL